MARISFQVQPIPGEKKFKDFQENFETIMETLLYLQNAFPKIIEDLEDPEDRYGVDVIIAFDADHIEAPDGQKGFGVFDTDTDHIYIAADIPEPEETLIETTDRRHAGADTAKETTFQEPGAIYRKQKETKEDRS